MPQVARFSAELSCDVLLWEFCFWGLISTDKTTWWALTESEMGDGNIESRTKISFKVILFPVSPFLAVGTYGKERKKVGRPLMVLVHDYI